MTDYLQEARAAAPELYRLREAFHRHPEPGNREFETANRIELYLKSCGIRTNRLTETAVVGTLYGALPGVTAALRADMDALPLREQTGAPFASENDGMMHACGHDIHMTAALGAAKLLSLHRDTLPGTVKLLFQPDEEGNGGAQRMLQAGALEGVSAVFGAHVAPDLPLGTVGIRYGKFYAASDMFTIAVLGRSAHGATPEKGIDALAAAARLVTALKALPGNFPDDRCVVTVGTLHAGAAGNILAGEAVMTGILRTLGPKVRQEMRQLVRDAAASVERETGTKITVELRESYPGIVNSDVPTAHAEAVSEALLGKEHVVRISEPTMTTEDFGYFAEAVPGCFYHLGAGCSLPLHNPCFLPQADAAVYGAAVHAAVLSSWLEAHSTQKNNP